MSLTRGGGEDGRRWEGRATKDSDGAWLGCGTNFVHHWSQGFQVRMSEMTRGVGFAPEYGPGPSLSIPALLERIYLQI